MVSLCSTQQEAARHLTHAIRAPSRARCGGYAPLQIAVHDGEEDLEEQVDGVYQHRQQVQPRFAGHCGGCVRRDTGGVWEAYGRKTRSSLAVSPMMSPTGLSAQAKRSEALPSRQGCRRAMGGCERERGGELARGWRGLAGKRDGVCMPAR